SGADGARAFKRKRDIDLLWRYKCARGAAKQYRLQASCASYASCYCHQLAQRGSHGNFIQAGPDDMSAEAKEPWPCGILRSNLCIGRAALAHDHGHVDQRLHVVDHRGLAEEPGLCGKW